MIFLCLSLSLLQTPAIAQTPAESENLWQKLCRWMGQGACQSNLAVHMAMATEKGDGSGRGALYLVNASTGDMNPWPTGGGAEQPTLCPDTKDLFYRRGSAIYKESIRIEKAGVSRSAGPYKIDGIETRNLYACTQDEKGSPILWVEDLDENIRHIRLKDGAYERVNLSLDAELAKVPPKELAEKISLLHGMRPDGYHVFVRDHKLVGQRPSELSLSYVVKPSTKRSMQFSGSPAWVGASDYFFTTASED
jgi:hypothetical protein